ncbi:MAG: helix-turn-helix transcriptional regulator [Alphaproteobacteria bacterium]|nr:helix-turn-helix transcriptional regulator [Alphaproteobacteria bacterium]MBT4016382.1 helix-turn-helix transcriptional regulator [Alphaproteobacteria bacterium]
MNSVAYSGEAAERLGTLAGRPVVTARKVLANALNLYLAYLGARPDNHFSNIEARLQAAAPNLTDRERQIIKLAVQGLSNKEAGLKLGISHRTVEKHRSSAMNKLGVSTISGLFRLVMVIK